MFKQQDLTWGFADGHVPSRGNFARKFDLFEDDLPAECAC